MKRIACLATLMTMTWTAGCVERRLIICSEPTGALVYHNGIYLGPTPVDRYVVYYGKQHFRLIKEGYETRDIVQDYSPPWYEFPGVDFLTENIWPFKVRDVRRYSYAMRPLRSIPTDEVRQRAEQLRARGKTIGVPAPPRPVAPAAAAPPPPPPSPPPQNTLPAPRPVPAPPPGVNAPSP